MKHSKFNKMTSPMLTYYVTCLLLGTMVHLASLKLSPSLHFEPVTAGQTVSLNCSFNHNTVAVMFYWYKHPLGQKPQLLSKFYKHDVNGTFSEEFKNDPRFKLETASGKNHLKISNVQMSDSATYYCISGYSYVYEFLEGTIIQVKNADLDIRASVHQSTTGTIKPGSSVILNCTVQTRSCDREVSVYWFKNSEESHPGLIYTHAGRSDHCERNPSHSQTQTCVYNLQMENFNVSHTGTYYCAVASCGRILFGNGTKLNIKEEGESFVYLYALSGALAFSSILLVLLAYAAYTMYTAKRCKCTDVRAGPPEASAPGAEEDEDHLHYAALKESKVTRSRRQKEATLNECVYSSVKQ